MTTPQAAPQTAPKDAWKRLGHALPDSGPFSSDVVWQELASYFSWFSRAATQSRVACQTLKILSLLLAAAVTVLAATGAPSVLTACVGAGIVVAEGTQFNVVTAAAIDPQSGVDGARCAARGDQ